MFNIARLFEKQPIFLEPVFKEMIWGGNKLSVEFGYDIPSENTAECWAIAAHKNGDSKIINNQFKGYTLGKLWLEHRELFGNLEGDVFPLLVKILDAKKDLSIQVHPDDEYAKINENGSLGKTECWYVLDCEEESTIIIGHIAKSKNELKTMIQESRWSELLRTVKIQKGDFFQIEPGCIHAIKAGTMILEIQQNSDVTYRLYDYDRLTPNGHPRELHTDKAFDVITVPFISSRTNKTVNCYEGYTCETLVKSKYYKVKKIIVTSHAEILQKYSFMNISVIDGSGTVDGIKIKKGSHFILPNNYGIAEFKGNMQLIISYL